MGEVYRAKDTKLGRSVAVKVLPDLFELDPERVSRFEREAKALAALNHPHIASLIGMEEADGRHFLIMELVDGETIADRLKRGAIPLQEALAIAIQIAEGLEAAHEKGIIHRDLKPANVKITPDGKVKVLDFGLAKAMDATPVDGTLSNSPTLSLMATQHGVILGTAAYMSPEQAKGLQTDQRSDIFSFGVVLYEMLTGRPPFQGDTAADILASVIVRDADVGTLPPNVNPRLPEIIQRCLEKNPKKRWQAIGDLRVELEAVAAAPFAVPATQVAATPRPLWKLAILLFAAALAGGALASVTVWMLKPSPQPTVTRFSITLPEGQQFTSPGRHTVAISPDGAHIVYVAGSRLHLRSMTEFDGRFLAGTDISQGLMNPVFSPNGRSVAFFSRADMTIKRMAITGGAAITVCRGLPPFGMTWDADGILFSEGIHGIKRCPATGGRPAALITVKPGEEAYGPQLMPDGRTVLFTLASGTHIARWEKAQIVAHTLDSGERKTLVDGGSDGRYLSTGHLVYVLSGVLFAVPFDAARLEVTGPPVPVVEGVRTSTGAQTGAAQYSVATTGSLVYIPGRVMASGEPTDLALIDRKGTAQPLKLAPGSYHAPRVSPDGKHVAFGGDDGKEEMIWVYNLAGTSSMRRLTFGGNNRFPVWSADSARVAYQSDRERDVAIFWQRADGAGPAERLTKAEDGTSHIPMSSSPDGKWLLFSVAKDRTTSLWVLSIQDRKSAPFGAVRAEGSFLPSAEFSPDGRWVAYVAHEGGSNEVYVQPFPPTGAKYQISKVGAIHPFWARNGKELFYQTPGQSWFVSVATQPTFTFGNPVPVSRGPTISSGPPVPRNSDIMPDGQRFIAVIPASTSQIGAPPAAQLNVVLNWFEELKQRVPR
jgi:hypothetical protein